MPNSSPNYVLARWAFCNIRKKDGSEYDILELEDLLDNDPEFRKQVIALHLKEPE